MRLVSRSEKRKLPFVRHQAPGETGLHHRPGQLQVAGSVQGEEPPVGNGAESIGPEPQAENRAGKLLEPKHAAHLHAPLAPVHPKGVNLDRVAV
jgi:hypothetical protein